MDVSDNLWDNDMLCAGYKIEKIAGCIDIVDINEEKCWT